MLRLIALILLMAIAPVGVADERGIPNRGQSVSECNQRANERGLKGQDRREFVAGCFNRYQAMMEDERRDRYRGCHARAADRGLHDASRRQYIEDCVTGRLDRRTLVMLGG